MVWASDLLSALALLQQRVQFLAQLGVVLAQLLISGAVLLDLLLDFRKRGLEMSGHLRPLLLVLAVATQGLVLGRASKLGKLLQWAAEPASERTPYPQRRVVLLDISAQTLQLASLGPQGANVVTESPDLLLLAALVHQLRTHAFVDWQRKLSGKSQLTSWACLLIKCWSFSSDVVQALRPSATQAASTATSVGTMTALRNERRRRGGGNRWLSFLPSSSKRPKSARNRSRGGAAPT